MIYFNDEPVLEDLPVTPELIAKRFISLFEMHGIKISEIPEIKGFESISLYELNSTDRLLQKLTPDFLKKTADFFGIRIEWLRSGEPDLYHHRFWYKNLTEFFEDLKEIDFNQIYDPFEIITINDTFDVHSDSYQPFLLVLKKHIAEIDDREVFRFYVELEWDWHHAPCRLQAKALATKYYELTHRMIPIYKVDRDTFKQLSNRYITPETEKTKNHKVSFEEFGALDFNYFDGPYEKEERDAVLEEMKEYKIDKIDYKYLNEVDEGDSLKKKGARSSKRGRKPSKEKREIKDRFISEYAQKIYKGDISADQAARDFYDRLTPEDERLLFRSQKDYDKATTDELTDRAERTLSDYYSDYKKSRNL